ncbi:unnamed protein product [Rhodiola kirilowii]
MQQELEAIERNRTWELCNLPDGMKAIGVKWIFKEKLNKNGDVDRYKARLVAKGYAQKYGIYYTEVFAPVAKWDTIRAVLAQACQRGMVIHQLDMKSAFLHGELTETVFVEQHPGFERLGSEDKVYKLKKALYGLKQAPRAWYNRIESYFSRNGFIKYPHEPTLFIKTITGGNILIISLYVDDLIVAGTNLSMVNEFKDSMKIEFDMTDLGDLSYFLGVEVVQDESGIYICQRKYAWQLLERFKMADCNAVRNPMAPGCKIVKDGGSGFVDATLSRKMWEA